MPRSAAGDTSSNPLIVDTPQKRRIIFGGPPSLIKQSTSRVFAPSTSRGPPGLKPAKQVGKGKNSLNDQAQPAAKRRIIFGGPPSLIGRSRITPAEKVAPSNAPGDTAANPLLVVGSPVKKQKYRIFSPAPGETATNPWVVVASPQKKKKAPLSPREQLRLRRRAKKDAEAVTWRALLPRPPPALRVSA
ncbi:hypothetical protein C8F04DRAFT_1196530 [Mycena alexandri]|uniref:Uncharacterized protein n=1 Tax=Mycena alexandri TaxID=1745969 RepID=A0AAD6WPR0_9AGAR|nr:hypothetical protein C8F04DRAFT_1196530 [Mycena alexandri]